MYPNDQPTRCKADPAARFPIVYGTGTHANVDITLPATPNQCWVIGVGGLVFSYKGGTPDGGVDLTETAGNTMVYSFDVTASGFGPVLYNKPIKFKMGEPARIRLRDGGVGIVGKLTLLDYWLESEANFAG